jgi:outer membrane protein assembly factor BamA
MLLPGSRVSAFYGQKVAKTEGSSKTEDDQLASDVRIGQIGTRFNLDRRDNLKFPTAGYTFDTELAWARYPLGGDLRYFRWDVGTSFYQGIVDDWVFAVGLNLTSYQDVERRGDIVGILPPSERLSSGGADSVRGYRPGTLGPLVRTPDFEVEDVDGTLRCNTGFDEQPLDGSSRTTIKTELRYKVNDSLATTGFVDNGNTFFSKEQMAVLEDAYEDPVRGEDRVIGTDGNPDPTCADEQAFRTVEDNIGYDWGELLRNPGYAWSRHYWSYGASLNLLTALGSVNFAYGLPWREPTTEACEADPSFCNPRGKQSGHWLLRGEFHLNVGARF